MMNERIRELAEQATVHGNTEHRLDIPSWYLEKFAELIVRECAKVALEHDAFWGASVDQDIKRHFGVE